MVRQIDIAEHLKLSRITISAVLNDRYQALGISEQTAEKVRKAAAEMGYQRNQLAMAVKTGKTYSLGILVSAFESRAWIMEVLRGALGAVRDTPYMVNIEASSCFDEEINAMNRFLGQRVEGILCINVVPSRDHIRQFRQSTQRYSVPIVSNNCASDLADTEVEADNEGGSRMAVKHLVELGHRKIAYIGGNDDSTSSVLRKTGFVDALGEFDLGLGSGHLRRCDWDLQRAEQAVVDFVSDRATAPTAVVCANDEMAAAALRAARQEGLRVPDDLSVVGFSNEPMTEVVDPPLTTVDLNEEKIGQKALKQLIRLVEKDEAAADDVDSLIVPASLVVRKSTAAPPAG